MCLINRADSTSVIVLILIFEFNHHQLDRFIPNRSAIDFDYAHYMLTEGAKGKENPAVASPSRDAYRKQLAETLNMNRTRILAFKNKPPEPVELIPHHTSAVQQDKPVKPKRFISQVLCFTKISLITVFWI